MKLPRADRARVDESKIRLYLLNAEHPDNGGKAAFFTALGFSTEEWELLATALVELAQRHDVIRVLESQHGSKYIVDGALAPPSGVRRAVRTVWITDAGADVARLVTAYPYKD